MFLQHKQYDLSSSTDRIHSFQIKGASTVVGIYINTMKTTFYLSFDVKQAYFKLNSQQREAVPIHSWLLPCSYTPLATPLFYTPLTYPYFYTPLTTPLFLYSPDNSPVPLLPDYTPVPILSSQLPCSFTP